MLKPICTIIKNNDGVVWIDSGSVGKGVADRLVELFESTIVPVSFGERPRNDEANKATGMVYDNLRSQLYFWSREDVSESAQLMRSGYEQTISVELNHELEQEVENTFYIPGDGKLKIEPKAHIKERIGRSPDDFDAFVLCNAARREYIARPVYVSGSSINKNNNRRVRLTSDY